MSEISKDELFEIIKNSHIWHAQRIKEQLEKIILTRHNSDDFDFRFDTEDKYFFIYVNECNLFIFDERIEVRSDRDNTYSTDKTFVFAIRGVADISAAFDKFDSVIMEDELD